MSNFDLVLGGIFVTLGITLRWATRNLPAGQLGFAPWAPDWLPRTLAGHQVYPVRVLAFGFLLLGVAWIVLGIVD